MSTFIPAVTILLLGESEVGKSTFISRLTDGTQEGNPPPYEPRQLRDLDQPFLFDIKIFNREFRFKIFDTAAPTNYTLLRPDFLILCYDISNRDTLELVHSKWKTIVETNFNLDESLPVMLLGLKRDLRREWTEEEKNADGSGGGGKGSSVMPQEGLRVAQEMLCDKYAECSAVTGELCREVLEDVARTAAKTTTFKGAKSNPPWCSIM